MRGSFHFMEEALGEDNWKVQKGRQGTLGEGLEQKLDFQKVAT